MKNNFNFYDYRTTKGARFGFSGWGEGGSPLERFDKQEWVLCLHGCMLAASFLPGEEARLLLEDDQILHELVHLIQGVDICTHNGMPALRRGIKKLQKRFENEQTIRCKNQEAAHS